MESIAAAAGVAISTVSRALKDDPRISVATRQRVHDVVKQLGYRPNPLVSALMAQLRRARPPAARCNLAWLDFLPQPEDWQRDPIHRSFYQGACERAHLLGYAVILIRAVGRTPERLARMLRDRGIQGVLLPAFDEAKGISTNIPLPLDKFAIVGVGTRFEQPSLHYSSDDQYECGRLALQRLWDYGYRRIGYAGELRVERIVNGRFLASYLACLQSEFVAPVLPPLLTTHDDEILAWLRTVRPQAIITPNRRILVTLRRLGVRVPEDVAIAHLNVDDVEGASAGEVAGVRQDNAGVGAHAVELLINLLYHNEIGVPVHPRGVQLKGTWVYGPTVRRVTVADGGDSPPSPAGVTALT